MTGESCSGNFLRVDEQERRQRSEMVFDAAVEAEMATGAHEGTVSEAGAHVVVRAVRMTFGAVVLVVGLGLLLLPGPGMVVVLAGLVVLAKDVPFAERLVVGVRGRVVREKAKRGPVVMYSAAAASVAAVAASAFLLAR